ncbi:hypothetical protein [Pigmentiphaga aceris]|uniref:hypothetical protein n=1 Tax=Pigmentiphaga aceris TaxID=1940612 RepID=UPI001FE6667F|nr:hypothetical protein [Pigmentiphaga aceris]
MNVFPNGIPSPTAVDADLAEQARPGHGVPSQDPDPAAQQLLSPEESAREAKSAYLGGGVAVGAAAGAAIGVAVAGPIGAVVGGTVGAVTGLGGGAAVGAAVSPEDTRDIGEMPIEPTDRDPRALNPTAVHPGAVHPTAETAIADTIIDPALPRAGDTRP